MTRRAVFTSILGGYEKLNEQPTALTSPVDFICLTDDPSSTSDTWHMVTVQPLLACDPARSQRDFKIRGHAALAEYDEVLYIDNTVRLLVDPDVILQDWLDGSDLTLVQHSFRATVLDEFDAVIASLLDDPARVHEQLFHYAARYPAALAEQPSWNGMFARRQTDEIRRLSEVWFSHVLRYSRRDQLSLNVALADAGVGPRRVTMDNHRTDFHEWPVLNERRVAQVPGSARSGPLLAEIGRLTRELDARIEQHEGDLAELRTDLHTAHATTARLQAESAAVTDTLSWRVTRPLRWVRHMTSRARA